ncbi:MAG: hypothetical protein HC919_12320 [Oscillatoriales cyanobacterium SM2_2_1]|nr:hypothetical protein [Oscillatoriales cyanobacterium SM2_2_1]
MAWGDRSLSILCLCVISPAAILAQTGTGRRFPNSLGNTVTFILPSGQPLVTRLVRSETLYIPSGETVSAQLRVDQEVRDRSGTVLIPVGATIEGQFVPVSGGSKYVAQSLTSRGATIRLQAESSTINDVKDPRETGLGSIAVDTAIGAATAAVLAGVIGDRVLSTEKILGGAVAGAILGNVTAPQVTVIEPNLAMTLTIQQELRFVQQ